MHKKTSLKNHIITAALLPLLTLLAPQNTYAAAGVNSVPAHCGISAGDFGIDFQTAACAGLINHETDAAVESTSNRVRALIAQAKKTEKDATIYLSMFPQKAFTLHNRILPQLLDSMHSGQPKPSSEYSPEALTTTWTYPLSGIKIVFKHTSHLKP